MDYFFGELKKTSVSLLVVGLLIKIVSAILCIAMTFSFSLGYFIIGVGGDLIIFIGSLMYFYGEDPDGDMKNVYGTILLSLLVNVFGILSVALNLPIPNQVSSIILFVGVVFELLSVVDMSLFVTNNVGESVNKVLTIILIVLTVICVGICLFFVFAMFTHTLNSEISRIIDMVLYGCLIGCFVISGFNLVYMNIYD